MKELFPDCPVEYPPEAYRYNPASIRLRVVHPSFRGQGRIERIRQVSSSLRDRLPVGTWEDIMALVLLTPDEIKKSYTNKEFENPGPRPRSNGRNNK